MRTLKLIVTGLTLIAGSALAAPVVWTVPPTTTTDGSILSGTFTFDTAIPGMTAVNLRSTGTTAATYTFVGGVNGPFYFAQASAVAVANTTPVVAFNLNAIPANAAPYTSNIALVNTCFIVTAGLCTNIGGANVANNVVLNAAAPDTGNTSTVPTLSEYAMILMASIIAMVGIWTMRKRVKN
jgi:hypothetical protein